MKRNTRALADQEFDLVHARYLPGDVRDSLRQCLRFIEAGNLDDKFHRIGRGRTPFNCAGAVTE